MREHCALLTFSAASGRGLIEACTGWALLLYRMGFSAASGRGLIEAGTLASMAAVSMAFSAASGRGLIEATRDILVAAHVCGFPRHRAAASLKLRGQR